MRKDKNSGLYVPSQAHTVGTFLNDLLEKAGSTQTELAKRAKVTRQTVNNILCDRTAPSPLTAMKLQMVLRCDALRLLRLSAETELNKISKKKYSMLRPLLEPTATNGDEGQDATRRSSRSSKRSPA